MLPHTGKGRKSRTLAIPPRAYSAITALIDERGSGPLLRTSSGRRISTDQIRSSIKVLAKRAGVGLTTHVDKENRKTVIDEIWLHPHTLRHTFATLARDSGGRLEDIQDALGHADPRTTRIYDRGRVKLDRSPTYSLDALIAQQTGSDYPSADDGSTTS